ncbi:MAG: hypothetical protein PHC52_14465, partial [Syntrophales bacterium]|nr:hypothetical protein [Syntrophales bacterium]
LEIQLVTFIQQIRQMDVKKPPSIGETIDWARVLLLLHANDLNPDLVRETLHVILKFEEDIRIVSQNIFTMTDISVRSAGN